MIKASCFDVITLPAFISHSAAELHAEAVRRTRGANKRPRKEQVAVRYDAEILAYFRATGKGW